MNKEVLSGIARAGLASIGGWLVSKGYATSEDAANLATNANALAGAVAILATAAWSWWSKKTAKK